MDKVNKFSLFFKHGSGWFAGGVAAGALCVSILNRRADNITRAKDNLEKIKIEKEILQLEKDKFEWQKSVDKDTLCIMRRELELKEKGGAGKRIYNYLMHMWDNSPDEAKTNITDTISEEDMFLENKENQIINEESLGTKILNDNMPYKNKKQVFDDVFNEGSDTTSASPILENNIDLYHTLGITSLFIGICLIFYIYICLYKENTNIYKVLPKPGNLGMTFIYLIGTCSTNNCIFKLFFLNFTQENLWQDVSLLYFAVIVTTIFLILIFNKYLSNYVKEVLPFVESIFILSGTLLLASIFNKIIVNFFLLMFILYIFNTIVLCLLYLRLYNKNLFKYCLVIFFIVLIIYNLFGLLFYFYFYGDLGFMEDAKELSKLNRILKQKYEELLNELRKLRKDV